ncbi:MAG: hypothetical protein FWG08_02355 [Propionibacteriaceae bacterium]|nr:hypothetical protein [Propionibacteriaceae bacterium]
MKTRILIILAIVAGLACGLALTFLLQERQRPAPDKPVICLYPEQPTDVRVELDYTGGLAYTYPAYGDAWEVTAYPDGHLINHSDSKEYSYLFWEGRQSIQYDMSQGFVVRGEDTATFLQEKLAYLGLTPREYNEFIVYWLPKMQDNPYNLIAFQGDTYTDAAQLKITPQPDSVLRVFMVFQPLDSPITVDEPQLVPFERSGFTVIEWGGAGPI